MSIIKDKMIELRRLKNEVNNCIFNYDGTFEKSIDLFSNALGCDEHVDIYNFSIVHNFSKGDVKKAKEIVDKAVSKFPFNFDLNTNAFAVYKELGEIEKAIEFYCNRYSMEKYDEDKNYYLEEVQNIIINMYKDKLISREEVHKLSQKAFNIMYHVGYEVFPIVSTEKEIAIGTNIAKDRDSEKYFTTLYKASKYLKNINKENVMLFKTETLIGNSFKRNTVIDNKKGDIFSIAGVNEDPLEICIKQGDKKLRETKIFSNSYKYFSLPVEGKLKIESNGEYFLSQIKYNNNVDKPKLVIYIAVDGLCQKFLDENDFKKLMPKTSKFFGKGYISKRCFPTGDWTMPSFASIATGKYTVNHNLFNGSATYNFEEYNKMIQEYFREEGYFTAKICNNRRVAPSFGYYKGFGRTLYQDNLGDFNCFDIIGECIEHIESFKHFNNYIELMFMDVHDIVYGEENHTGVLSEVSYDSTCVSSEYENVVPSRYNKNKIAIYKNEIKRIDLMLSLLYNYIEENYKDDEFIICLNSDHGHSFLQKPLPFMDENDVETRLSFLHESKNSVVFMLRGINVPVMESDKLMENIDVMPTLLKLCNIELKDKIDGWVIEDLGGKEKQYTYSEIFHPDRVYRVVITDNSHSFYFETESLLTDDGVVDVDDYKFYIVNRETKKIENEEEHEKVAYYINIVFDHIKSRIKI